MVTFIVRDYPDLDHIFPIIHFFLKKNNAINILNFEINLNLESDPRIIFLNKKFKKNLNIYGVYNIKGERLFLDKILNFLSSKNFKHVNFKNLKQIEKNNNFFKMYFLILICFLKKTIFSSNSPLELFFFNSTWAKNIFKNIDITSLVLDDSYYFNYRRPQSFINTCKEKNIRITLVPHTCHMFSRNEDLENLKSKKLDNFYPNIAVTSNKMKIIMNNCGIDISKIKNLGSARFSEENINLYNSIYSKNINFLKKSKKNKKLKILYIDGAYDDKSEKIKLIETVSKIPFVDFVVKAHPRGIFLSSQLSLKEKQFKKNNFSNFLIDISTPTKKLIDNSDIIIGTYSSILIEAMLIYKKIILPRYFLKELDFKIFYEKYGFAEVCQDLEQIILFLNNFKKDQSLSQISKKKTDSFIMEYVYGGQSNSYNILESYYKLIK